MSRLAFRPAVAFAVVLLAALLGLFMVALPNAPWQLGPFVRYEQNPILEPRGETWEAKDIFNPSVWTDGETIWMLYRAEDTTGRGAWNGTSRIGLATSRDGLHFQRESEPVLEPSEEWEIPGGVEDPRMVKVNDAFYLTSPPTTARPPAWPWRLQRTSTTGRNMAWCFPSAAGRKPAPFWRLRSTESIGCILAMKTSGRPPRPT